MRAFGALIKTERKRERENAARIPIANGRGRKQNYSLLLKLISFHEKLQSVIIPEKPTMSQLFVCVCVFYPQLLQACIVRL